MPLSRCLRSARPIDVRREVNGRLTLANRSEHRRKDLVAVLEHLDLVALDDSLPCGAVKRPEKRLEIGLDQRHANHPILMFRFGISGKRDVDERCRRGR